MYICVAILLCTYQMCGFLRWSGEEAGILELELHMVIRFWSSERAASVFNHGTISLVRVFFIY